MDEQTLKALQEAAAHWKRMATGTAGPGEAPYSEHCALCKLFRGEHIHNVCDGCPVKEETGQRQCRGTPYYNARDAYERSGKNSPLFLLSADMMWEFLQSLLPRSKKAKTKAKTNKLSA